MVVYVCKYVRSKRDGICEKAGLIYLFVRARRQRQTGKRMGGKKRSERWRRDIVGVSDVFAEANNKKWSGARLRPTTSLAPEECVSLSEPDLKTPDEPCLAFFSALVWERESMRVREIYKVAFVFRPVLFFGG